MTDLNEYAAGQIRQQGSTLVQGGPVQSEQDIARAAQAHAGIGVTEADIDQIRAQLARVQRQPDGQAAAQPTLTADSLTGSVASLVHYLEGHGDPAALELGKDATEAARAAADGGDTGAPSGGGGKV